MHIYNIRYIYHAYTMHDIYTMHINMIFMLFIHYSFIGYSRNVRGKYFIYSNGRSHLFVSNNGSFQEERYNYTKKSFTPMINPFIQILNHVHQ